MQPKPKYAARIDNIYFLRRVGASLRAATAELTRQELPRDIRHLLRLLERQEVPGSRRRPD